MSSCPRGYSTPWPTCRPSAWTGRASPPSATSRASRTFTASTCKRTRSSGLRTWPASPPCGNRIRQVENLLGLPCLQFLDLSENQIETLKLEEFPQSLLILNLTGNKCTTQDGYRELVTKALPLLLDLDGQPVSERWNSDEEQASGDEDEEFPELSGPFCSDQAPWLLPGFLKELEQQLSRLREHRQQAALADHLLRMEMKPTLTSLPPQPPGVPMAGDSSPSPMPRQGKETAPEAPTSSLASSPTKKSCPLIPRHQPSSQARKDSHVTTAPKISNPTKTVTKRVKK
ncbi:leucine-rich repeat-containing protein 46 isoform X3 [Ochotona princeps]|uniref:leucine-rich repeat-containing protein 46 isoform X3 n=1 Tax=Ochotona princeps TaxID=9978 RepID=UPI002714F57D|nr:leucine-rich repeat-containing protein 46 isoform X3 [Ochotona princeps]